jgi:hypothetical protein
VIVALVHQHEPTLVDSVADGAAELVDAGVELSLGRPRW